MSKTFSRLFLILIYLNSQLLCTQKNQQDKKISQKSGTTQQTFSFEKPGNNDFKYQGSIFNQSSNGINNEKNIKKTFKENGNLNGDFMIKLKPNIALAMCKKSTDKLKKMNEDFKKSFENMKISNNNNIMNAVQKDVKKNQFSFPKIENLKQFDFSTQINQQVNGLHKMVNSNPYISTKIKKQINSLPKIVNSNQLDFSSQIRKQVNALPEMLDSNEFDFSSQIKQKQNSLPKIINEDFDFSSQIKQPEFTEQKIIDSNDFNFTTQIKQQEIFPKMNFNESNFSPQTTKEGINLLKLELEKFEENKKKQVLPIMMDSNEFDFDSQLSGQEKKIIPRTNLLDSNEFNFVSQLEQKNGQAKKSNQPFLNMINPFSLKSNMKVKDKSEIFNFNPKKIDNPPILNMINQFSFNKNEKVDNEIFSFKKNKIQNPPTILNMINPFSINKDEKVENKIFDFNIKKIENQPILNKLNPKILSMALPLSSNKNEKFENKIQFFSSIQPKKQVKPLIKLVNPIVSEKIDNFTNLNFDQKKKPIQIFSNINKTFSFKKPEHCTN